MTGETACSGAVLGESRDDCDIRYGLGLDAPGSSRSANLRCNFVNRNGGTNAEKGANQTQTNRMAPYC
jgi:hypothetical protein